MRADLNRESRLLFDMLRIRLIEEGIADLYSEQEMRCPVHLCIGQEAVAVGVSAALTTRDYVMSGHRSHGHYLAQGGDLKAMMAEIYGRATGCSSGNGGSMHLTDLSVGFLGATPIVASTIPILTGTAFSSKYRGEDRVSVSYFGEAATEEGVFCESLNFAALHQLPVVFVCENNRFSVYSPLEVRQPPSRDLCAIARGHGVESLAGDGNDVSVVRELTQRGVQRARSKGGPTLLYFDTYRWREHCGPNYDHELPYRARAEFDEWKARCPIESYRQRLIDQGSLTSAEYDRWQAEIRDEFSAAVAFAKSSPFPDSSRLSADVYASCPNEEAIR